MSRPQKKQIIPIKQRHREWWGENKAIILCPETINYKSGIRKVTTTVENNKTTNVLFVFSPFKIPSEWRKPACFGRIFKHPKPSELFHIEIEYRSYYVQIKHHLMYVWEVFFAVRLIFPANQLCGCTQGRVLIFPRLQTLLWSRPVETSYGSSTLAKQCERTWTLAAGLFPKHHFDQQLSYSWYDSHVTVHRLEQRPFLSPGA